MAKRAEVNCSICHSFSHLAKDHFKNHKVLGFKKERIIFDNSLGAWLVKKHNLVPVVTLEKYQKLEKAYAKLANEAAEYAFKAGRAEGELIHKKLKEEKYVK